MTTPLEFQLAEQGSTNQLRELLLRAGASAPRIISSFSPTSQGTLLYHAALSGNLSCCQMLVDEFKADLSQPCTQFSNTPLHAAVFRGHADIARFLLERGAVPRPNAFGDFPADQLEKSCPQRTVEQVNQTQHVLRTLRGAAQRGTTSVTAPSKEAFPAANGSSVVQLPPNAPLPMQCEELRKLYPEPRLAWFSTANDFIAKGLLPYTYKNNTYYTPVVLFCAKAPAEGDAMTYRAMLDVNNLNGLAISSRAPYIDSVSGSIIPKPPFRYHSFSHFVREAVIAMFEKTPPLVDSASSTAIRPGTSNAMSSGRRIWMELSAFHDGALQFKPGSNTVEGAIPVFPNNNRAFKPIASVPIRITLVHLTHGHSTQPPLVFVAPLDQDMCLVGTPIVDGVTGQVRQLPSLATWNTSSTLTGLLKELQSSFTQHIPIQAAQPRNNTIDGSAQPSNSGSGGVNVQTVVASPPQPSPPPSSSSNDDSRLCVICYDNQKTYIALPCRHLLFCDNCVQAFTRQAKQECPVCRKAISDLFEIYT